MIEAKTAVMVVTFNRLELTKQTFDSLFETAGHNFNLIIVDNGSTDGTREYLETILKKEGKYLKSVVVKLNEENKGIAIGRNQALKIANDIGTNYYCTIDNDVLMPNGWLGECVDILDKVPRYGAIGVNMEGNGYQIININGKTFQNKPAGNLGTACMVFPRAVHQMIGFFNTTYGTYGLEDSDFGMRIRVAGFKLGYIEQMGSHLGVGELDKGEYRKFKTETHDKFLSKFNANCGAYVRKEKPIYLAYKE
jgi:GT2 family glycosyltransferase